MYDYILVGGGHNGLTCAAYLAKGGKQVLLLEARDIVGGLCWTKEMDNAPGYHVNPCGSEFLLTGVEPSVDTDLELHRYGLRWVQPDTLTTWLGLNGESLAIWKDRQKTVEEIRKFSRKDAVRYEQLVDEITDTLKSVLPYMHGHPFRPKPGALLECLRNAYRGRKNLPRGARLMLGSLDSVVDEYFERDEVKTPLAAYSLANFGPTNEPGSGLHMSLLAGVHEWGKRHPVGGSGAFTQALARCFEAHGGEIRTGAVVREISVRNGRATGVVLEDGQVLAAKEVIAALDPHTLLTKLLEPADVGEEPLAQLRGLQSLRNNMYTFKVDMALTERPNFAAYGREDRAMSAPMICPSLDYLREGNMAAMNGTYTDKIAFQSIMSSVHDRSLVPAGSGGDTLYFYAFNTPVQLSEERDWGIEKKKYADTLIDIYEQYAPGFKKNIIDIELTSPPEFAERYFVHKGSYEHADVVISQMGPWRPIPALAGYKTPVEGLWHTASGAFPMAFLSGWPGRNTAQMLLSKSPKQRMLTAVGLG